METQMIPAFAKLVADTFPILKGRSIAVSEVDLFKNSSEIPTLPLAFTALLGENASAGKYGINQSVQLTASILLQFMFEPVKYVNKGGSESVFFAFYDYEAIRDKLLSATMTWRTPRGGSVGYESLDVSSDTFAVYITFRFSVTEAWELRCHGGDLPLDEQPREFEIAVVTSTPRGVCCIPDEPETDPCPPTVKPIFKAI